MKNKQMMEWKNRIVTKCKTFNDNPSKIELIQIARKIHDLKKVFEGTSKIQGWS